MKIDYDPNEFETIFRPNYELTQFRWLSAGALGYAVAGFLNVMPSGMLYWVSLLLALMALPKGQRGLALKRTQNRLIGEPIKCCTLEQLRKIGTSQAHRDDVWLGRGFTWQVRHTQRTSDILKRDWNDIVNAVQNPKWQKERLRRHFLTLDGLLHPWALEKRLKEEQKRVTESMGQPWIHGLEPQEDDLWLKVSHIEGHALIVGTTGSGKTRMFDLFISQMILRGEPVFIIDPKGDRDLRDNAKRACEALGRGDAFVMFDPAKPRQSIRINPLANWTVPTELASRIMSIVPNSRGGDAFTSFAWDATNKIVQAMVICMNRPTLKNIRSRLEGGSTPLLIQSIFAWGVKSLGEQTAQDEINNLGINLSGDLNNDLIAKKMVMWYRTRLQPSYGSPEIEGMISLFEHDATHFSKMVSSLIPAIAKVTTGELGQLLSPAGDQESALNEYRDIAELIDNRCVVYIALSSLRDSEVASAIGSMMLADAASVAGSRYAYDNQKTPINMFVDEASEVANDPLIQLLNKGRGAGYRMFVATQTFADFAVRLGSADKATQVLSNLNNTFVLRTTEPRSQEMLCKSMPEVKVKYVMRDQGQHIGENNPIFSGGSLGERLMEEKSQLIPPSLLGMLPNLEFFASLSGGHYVKGRLPILVADPSEFKPK